MDNLEFARLRQLERFDNRRRSVLKRVLDAILFPLWIMGMFLLLIVLDWTFGPWRG